jgi:uncharacterized protein (DUF1778 family)
MTELAEHVEEARRVGAARHEAHHLLTRLDQPVPPNMGVDALAELAHRVLLRDK